MKWPFRKQVPPHPCVRCQKNDDLLRSILIDLDKMELECEKGKLAVLKMEQEIHVLKVENRRLRGEAPPC